APLTAPKRKGWLRQLRLDDRGRQRFLRIKSRQPTRKIFQLTDIAGPTMTFEPFKRGLVYLLWGQSFTLGLREEVSDEVGDILRAFSQRRQTQRHDVEAEEQILAKQTLLDQKPQVFIRCRDDPHVTLDGSAASYRRVLALLQHAKQACLCLHRHVADLIQEQGASLGLLKAPRTSGVRTGKGPLLVSK